MILGVSWWVYVVIFLIFFSGVMSYRAMQAERKLEEEAAEQEGKIYMERMEIERDRRRQGSH
ncbi:sporulation YhaL family protein [Virgibacillus xinjiangensis]|uniref:Sporulation YhaL family protein n=1 Tax=Virgibacillus xinjiangensis TaxID=393090 RepID=A0ABV7CWF2_9BACI